MASLAVATNSPAHTVPMVCELLVLVSSLQCQQLALARWHVPVGQSAVFQYCLVVYLVLFLLFIPGFGATCLEPLQSVEDIFQFPRYFCLPSCYSVILISKLDVSAFSFAWLWVISFLNGGLFQRLWVSNSVPVSTQCSFPSSLAEFNCVLKDLQYFSYSQRGLTQFHCTVWGGQLHLHPYVRQTSIQPRSIFSQNHSCLTLPVWPIFYTYLYFAVGRSSLFSKVTSYWVNCRGLIFPSAASSRSPLGLTQSHIQKASGAVSPRLKPL
jgi:hypothetical protein